MAERKYWFKAKRYGWGWYPSSWQGWLITLVAIIAIVMISISVDKYSHSVSDTLIGVVVPVIAIACALTFTAWLTGEKPGWRWGDKD